MFNWKVRTYSVVVVVITIPGCTRFHFFVSFYFIFKFKYSFLSKVKFHGPNAQVQLSDAIWLSGRRLVCVCRVIGDRFGGNVWRANSHNFDYALHMSRAHGAHQNQVLPIKVERNECMRLSSTRGMYVVCILNGFRAQTLSCKAKRSDGRLKIVIVSLCSHHARLESRFMVPLFAFDMRRCPWSVLRCGRRWRVSRSNAY